VSTTAAVLLAVAGVGFTLVLAIVCGALVEVFRQLADIRQAFDLDDEPLPLDLGRNGLRAAELGLPARIEGLPEAIVVFLSTKCAACASIAHLFSGGSPESVWFVVQAEHDAASLIETLERAGERLVVDIDGRMTAELGLEVTPSVLTVRYGEVVRAQAVSSPRQVLGLVPVVAPVGRGAFARDGGSRLSREPVVSFDHERA
jgi:hypothetical protein